MLVVEDEPRMATLLRRGFTEEGYSVDVTGDGHEGLWLATENDYDAIVLDVLLPGLDGFDVCRQLRADDRWAPVLLLTARDAVDDRVHGLDAGADDYLTKPFSLHEFGGTSPCAGARARPARALPSSGSAICASTRRPITWHGDTELHLSPKEMSLLELFLRHPGEVLTRTHILDHVWDFAYDGGSNVVDQYVGYLRKKVDRPFGRADIETVRGVGYRLGVPVPG